MEDQIVNIRCWLPMIKQIWLE